MKCFKQWCYNWIGYIKTNTDYLERGTAMMEGKCCYGDIKSVQKLYDHTEYFMFCFIMVLKN